jgi:uncharacterized membrane protein YkvA (DUF1232 family)
MNDERKPVVTPEPFGALGQLVQTLRLVWRLIQDPRVPIFPKLIIPAAIVYVFSPIDLLPDLILGLGQVDDIAILFFSIRFFIEMCPPDIVEEHRRALTVSQTRSGAAPEDVVEGSYHVKSDDD